MERVEQKVSAFGIEIKIRSRGRKNADSNSGRRCPVGFRFDELFFCACSLLSPSPPFSFFPSPSESTNPLNY